MNLSVTLLSSYLYCPRKVFLEKVLGLKEPPKPALLLGTIRHTTLEKANEAEQQVVERMEEFLTLDETITKYKNAYTSFLRGSIETYANSLHSLGIDPLDAYHKAKESILIEAQTRACNVHSFMHVHRVLGKELWQKLTPKIKSELRLESNRLRLKGIVDQIHHHPEKVVVGELKTGRAPSEGVWPGHKIQVVAYSMLLEEHLKKPVEEAFIHYLDTNQKRKILINPFMKMEVEQLVEEVTQLLDNRLLPDYVSIKNKCKNCGLRRQCYNTEEMDKRINSLLSQPYQSRLLVE